jgi:hypothetical protein
MDMAVLAGPWGGCSIKARRFSDSSQGVPNLFPSARRTRKISVVAAVNWPGTELAAP